MTVNQNMIGARLTEATADQQFQLGTTIKGDAGSEWVYVQADGAIVANDVVILSVAYQADQIDTTNSAGAVGQIVGVAAHAFADNEYGFVQIKGAATVNVGSSAATGTKLNTTATAGRVDDDGTSGAETILGLYTTAAESSNAAAAFLNYPFIDATL